MSTDEKTRLIGNIVGSLRGVPHEIQVRQARHFYQADPVYGEGVAEGLGIVLNEIKAA